MARTLEEAGFSTLLVTMMPYWAEKIGTPRTLAVEHPFGHTLGEPGDRDGQLTILRQALQALESIDTPGTIVHSDARWAVSPEEAVKHWQPTEPSPIIHELRPRFRQMLKEHRRK